MGSEMEFVAGEVVNDLAIAAAAAKEELEAQQELSCVAERTTLGLKSSENVDGIRMGKSDEAVPCDEVIGEVSDNMDDAMTSGLLGDPQLEGQGLVGTQHEGSTESSTSEGESDDSSDDEGHSENEMASSSEHDTDLDSDDESYPELTSYDELRKIIDGLNEYDEENTTTKTDLINGKSPFSAAQELFGGTALPALTAINIQEDDTISLAGTVANIIEGTVVIKAAEGSRPLQEGCLLVLGNRFLVGIIEDIFGPVQSPMYVSRLMQEDPTSMDNLTVHGLKDNENVSGKEERSNSLGFRDESPDGQESLVEGTKNSAPENRLPVETKETNSIDGKKQELQIATLKDLVPGMKVFTVDRLADFVLPEKLRVKGYDTDLGPLGEPLDVEAQFSDDEKEAEYKRSLKGKKSKSKNNRKELVLDHDAMAKDIAQHQGSRNRKKKNFKGERLSTSRPQSQHEHRVRPCMPHGMPVPTHPAGQYFAGHLYRGRPAFNQGFVTPVGPNMMHQMPSSTMMLPGYASGPGYGFHQFQHNKEWQSQRGSDNPNAANPTCYNVAGFPSAMPPPPPIPSIHPSQPMIAPHLNTSDGNNNYNSNQNTVPLQGSGLTLQPHHVHNASQSQNTFYADKHQDYK